MSNQKRNQRKRLVGAVTQRSGNKTIKVTYFYKKLHSLYKKEIKRKTVLYVHDEQNASQVGDKVEVMQTRPLSKLKRWRVVRRIETSAPDETTQRDA